MSGPSGSDIVSGRPEARLKDRGANPDEAAFRLDPPDFLPIRDWRFLRAPVAYIAVVSSDVGEETVTSREAVLSAEPGDDAGAQTADRYEWQAAMAAADALSVYRDALENGRSAVDYDAGIICEHHEDWVVVVAGEAELVSGKHRDPSVAVFTTIPQLLGDGRLAHLFGRWHAMGELAYCRLVTTAGLGPMPLSVS